VTNEERIEKLHAENRRLRHENRQLRGELAEARKEVGRLREYSIAVGKAGTASGLRDVVNDDRVPAELRDKARQALKDAGMEEARDAG